VAPASALALVKDVPLPELPNSDVSADIDAARGEIYVLRTQFIGGQEGELLSDMGVFDIATGVYHEVRGAPTALTSSSSVSAFAVVPSAGAGAGAGAGAVLYVEKRGVFAVSIADFAVTSTKQVFAASSLLVTPGLVQLLPDWYASYIMNHIAIEKTSGKVYSVYHQADYWTNETDLSALVHIDIDM
jgi:hypothetical protein